MSEGILVEHLTMLRATTNGMILQATTILRIFVTSGLHVHSYLSACAGSRRAAWREG